MLFRSKVPGGRMTPVTERALDTYVSNWNETQARAGEPYRLSWSPNPMGVDLVGFHLELK